MNGHERLLQPGGGYRNLKSFRLARVCYDVTVRFVELYIPRGSRTRDQMEQAARSGVQNIAEGSVAAASSSRTELKLTNVARASLEELRLDYEDYLRQHGMVIWSKNDVFRAEFVRRRVSSNRQFRDFIEWVEKRRPAGQGKDCIVANAALLLIDAASFFLGRQIRVQSERFLANGGFSERMARLRRRHLCSDE